jgi:hypothetical protein
MAYFLLFTAYYILSSYFDKFPFGTYFWPIFAYILANGFATYFFLSSDYPMAPGLSALPL